MKKNKRLFVLAPSLSFSTVSYAANEPPAAAPADDVDVLVALLKSECKKGVNNCLSVIYQEDVRRASNAASLDIGLFGRSGNNSKYEDDAHHYRYKDVKTSADDVFKIGTSFHIEANMAQASLTLSGAMNGIGIEAKPTKGSTQLRIDLLGIDCADSNHDLYAAIPVSIELDLDSIKRLGNSISEKVKAALSDSNSNTKLYVYPQVVDIRPRNGEDKDGRLRRRALELQTDMNSICENRLPNATMSFTNDAMAMIGSVGAPTVTSNGEHQSKTVFQEYRRYLYDVTNKDGGSYGSVALYGAKMYLRGLDNTASLSSIASALFSLSGSHSTSAVQYMGYGLNTPGVMLTDISGTQIGQPTYIVNVYGGFQNAKDEIDKSANEAPKALAAANATPEQKKASLEKAGDKATSDISAGLQQAKEAVASGDGRKTEAAAADAASKAAAATTALSTANKASSNGSAVSQAGPATIPLSNINAVSN